MSRPDTEVVLMQSAFLWAERSTCSRLSVGAVFARDGRILMTGYNGAPSGLPHCEHPCTCQDIIRSGKTAVTSISPGAHLEGCRSQEFCTTAEHAERNAIAWAARYGTRLEESRLFVTHMPCLACAMSIINAGVERVYYFHPYRDDSGVKLIRRAGVGVFEMHER